MNAFELNKYMGAILAALVFVMGLSVLSDIIFSEERPEQLGYEVVVASDEESESESAEGAQEEPFEVLLASADPQAGEGAARVCSACHAFDEGGGNGIGPALYNVVGRDIASVDGFGYSSALQSHAEEAPAWSYAELDGFLENPQGWVPGTSMGYAGISDRQTRADVIAYLKSVSPDAPALPEPPAADESAGEDEVAASEDGGEGSEGETQMAAADAQSTDGASADASSEGEAAASGGGDSFAQLVASSDPAEGEANATVCAACHNFEEGGPNMLGPNLYGVFGAPIAAADGFSYSDAMQTYAEDEGNWNVENLNAYLEAPMEVVEGTRMSYAGVKDETQRAQIIAYLHSVSPEAGPIEASAGSAEGAQESTDTAASDGEAQTETAAADPASTAQDAPQGSDAASSDAEASDAASSDAEESNAAETAAPAEEGSDAGEPATQDAAAADDGSATEGESAAASSSDEGTSVAAVDPEGSGEEESASGDGAASTATIEEGGGEDASGEGSAADAGGEQDAASAEADEALPEPVENANLSTAAGRDTPNPDDPSVENVAEAAADSIASVENEVSASELAASSDEGSDTRPTGVRIERAVPGRVEIVNPASDESTN